LFEHLHRTDSADKDLSARADAHGDGYGHPDRDADGHAYRHAHRVSARPRETRGTLVECMDVSIPFTIGDGDSDDSVALGLRNRFRTRARSGLEPMSLAAFVSHSPASPFLYAMENANRRALSNESVSWVDA